MASTGNIIPLEAGWNDEIKAKVREAMDRFAQADVYRAFCYAAAHILRVSELEGDA